MRVKSGESADLKQFFEPVEYDMYSLFEQIRSNDAVSVKILRDEFRKLLFDEAKRIPYTREEEYVGSGEKTVIQQLGTFKDFPEDSGFIRLRDRFREFIDLKICGITPYPFETELNFNSPELIRYEQGSTGITPHRDGLKYRNLICIFNISGRGRFFICDDRKGNNPVEFDTTPGNVILMRAPGFMGSDHRPFHFVRGITEERYVFVLRQRKV